MTPREHLSAARKSLKKERDAVVDLLSEAEVCAERAVTAFEHGRHEEARRELEKGCDLEFEALCDCDALGGLSEALYPSEVP